MNTTQVIARVQNIFGSSMSTTMARSLVVDWINEAQLEICRETHYKVGTNTSNTANDLRSGVSITDLLLVRTVKYGTKPLSIIDTETIDRMGVRNIADAEPQAYYMVGPTMYLFPQPVSGDTTTITISYVKAPTDLTDADSSLDIPVVYHNDLCNYCIMRAHERDGEFESAAVYEGKFRASMGQRKFEGMSQDDTFRQMGPDIMDYQPFFTVQDY